MDETKICKSCGRERPLTAYRRTRGGAVCGICNDCVTEKRAQTRYDRFVDGLKKLIKETNLIMNNVRAVGCEQQAKDNDLRAKYAVMKMMLETVKK